MTTATRQISIADALSNARQLLERHPDKAIQQSENILTAEPRITEAHFIIASAKRQLGEFSAADTAERAGLKAAEEDVVMVRAKSLIDDNAINEAERLLNLHLGDSPNDPVALRQLALVATKLGQLERAELLLKRSLSIAPTYQPADADLWDVLERKASTFRRDLDKPETPPVGTDELADAIKANERAVETDPQNARNWLSMGHVKRIAGHHDDAVAAYRRAVALQPSFGEAWWSLADLKTVAMSDDDVATIERSLGDPATSNQDRTGLEFALGKALDERGDHRSAFQHFATGNGLRRAKLHYNANSLDQYVTEALARFDERFFAERKGFGRAENDPIFIVGMPRSGSTLVEQMLATHPLIEGTEELQYLTNLSTIVARGARAGIERSDYLDALANLNDDKSKVLAGAYLWNAEKVRKSRRPYFVDKMPRNWMYLPMIRLMFPNAKVIDVRRDAMDCCWSNFKQLYADSGEYSYDLTELGRHYRSYERMMDAMAARLPDFVCKVDYADLTAQPREQMERLFDFLAIPFDESILQFHANSRAVKTSSSEQVRRPINRDGMGQWLPYAEDLTPLSDALGVKA